MLSSKFLMLASVGLVSLHTVSALHCSAACNTCCPQGRSGEELQIDENGDCRTASGTSECRLGVGNCLTGSAPTKCVAPEIASITITPPNGGGIGANAAAFLHAESFFHNGLPAWRNLLGSQFQNFPPHYLTLFSSVVSDDYTLAAGSSVKYHCPATGEHCDVVVFFYECAPCLSEKGGIAGYLAANSYVRTRCAPTFTTGVVNGIQHRMTGFVKRIAPGADEEILLPGDLEFALFGLSNGGSKDCPSFPTAPTCNDPSNDDFCRYNGGSCQINTCVQQGPIPSGCSLATCVHTEVGQPAPAPIMVK